jgi:hypothetical protein
VPTSATLSHTLDYLDQTLVSLRVGNMKREQSKTSGKAEQPEHSGKDTPRQPRQGEGAASALESLKKLERDRANNKPADDRPGS